MTTAITDLIQDAALVGAECMNNLPETARRRVATALDFGGEIEVRCRLKGDGPASVSVWVFNQNGQCIELGSTQSGSNGH